MVKIFLLHFQVFIMVKEKEASVQWCYFYGSLLDQ